jgi:ATP-dependent DNA helicase RecQ
VFRIVATRKPEGGYYNALKNFLMRYYSAERAELEMQNAYGFRGENEIQKCLGYITDFVYTKIAAKRKQAIKDIHDFCISAVNSNDHWLEVNEQLKDFIYYYFNSKFAREGYTIKSGEAFSLTDDCDRGRVSSFDILFKYLRVVDDNVVGASGSPKDNIKHLQGAVRLIRRSLTEANPALDLLNAFCLFTLKVNESTNLFEELKQSFINGYSEFRNRSTNLSDFYENMDKYIELLKEKNAVTKKDLKRINLWVKIAELKDHTKWITDFESEYTKDLDKLETSLPTEGKVEKDKKKSNK